MVQVPTTPPARRGHVPQAQSQASAPLRDRVRRTQERPPRRYDHSDDTPGPRPGREVDALEAPDGRTEGGWTGSKDCLIFPPASTQIAAAISSPVAGTVFTIRFVIGRPGLRSLAMVGKRLRYQDQTAKVVYRL